MPVEAGFGTLLLVFGSLLAVAAGLSGLFRGTVLSISVMAVAAGVVLAVSGIVSVEPGDQSILHLVELALLLTLFADGLVAERELVRTQWRQPGRALVIAMPLTGLIVALAAKWLFSLSWPEAFLLGAVLMPTDPVVTSTLLSADRVPALIRHTLNLESGLNDGLALPFVLILLAVATGGQAGDSALVQAGETIAGAAAGLAVAYVGGKALEHLPGGEIVERYEGVYAIGLALLSFGLAEVTYGNGLIAAFVAGFWLALAERELPERFGVVNENVSAVAQVVTFVVFGALIVETGYGGSIWGLAVFVALTLLVARPAAVMAAFAGSDLPRPQKLFIAWFGPKGVASMLFALYVLNSGLPDRTLVFDIASFTILVSIAAHGLTDTVGARWIEARVR